ncbi:MFS transporter [Spongiactinospora sp. TRM90649]|uniref:MFS transporter n=1 Tax=Spongiactinospora sp. TRM90649 TaxID=3031114 RepID=UPI0023F946CB|nr:MFS transporter [Spongiactinospora sp. TRM90649]MDF5756948.1 MFS transporter [Spongiactinospora sp. TRM90649]
MKSRSLTVGLVAMVSLVAFEYLAVAVAMPVVARELGGAHLYGLAFSGAMAAGVVGTVIGGRWADLRGPAAPLWSGAVAFGGGLLLAGLAQNMETLIAGRLVQGLGGALINVSLYVLVARVYPEAQHPKIFSLFATAWVVPSMVGPALVGAVAAAGHWRLVFLAVPFLTVIAGIFLVRGLAGQPISGGQAEPAPGLLRKTGWAVLTAVGAGLMQYGSDGEPVLLAVGVLVLLLALPRLLPKGTVRAARGLPAVVALRGLTAGAFFAAEVMVPLMLDAKYFLSPLTAGLALTGGALSWSFASWLQGREVFSRMVNLVAGTASISAGIALMGVVSFGLGPVALAYPSWIVAGFGMGLVYPTLSVLTLELSARGEQGVNSSALQVGEMVFSVVAVAVTSALFIATANGHWSVFAATLVLTLLGLAVAPRTTRRIVADVREAVGARG